MKQSVKTFKYERLADEILSLPIYPELTSQMIENIGTCLEQILRAPRDFAQQAAYLAYAPSP